jgi:multicomponent K+:H+ antiporter subunit E
MKRLLPAPLVTVVLFALWLVLNQSLAAGQLILAAVVALAVPILSAPLRPLLARLRRPGTVARLILTVACDVVESNWQVGSRIASADRHPPRSAFVKVPLALRNADGLAALAVITTIIPGTVWSELAGDRSALLLHVFDVDDEAAFVTEFKDRYERPLMEIFE